MRSIKKYFFFAYFALATLQNIAIAAENIDYGTDYYQNEGSLLFKIRGYGIVASAKQKGLPTPLVTDAKSSNPFIENGGGGDTATSIFVTDNIVTELSLGFGVLNTKSSILNNIAYNYNGTPSTSKRKLYMVPLILTGQYHIAPYGALRPYVGAGYQGTYLFTKNKEYKIKNGHGPVLQIGVDLVSKDDSFINFDVRKYWMKAKVNYRGALVQNAGNISSTVKIDPLLVSVGVGFRL